MSAVYNRLNLEPGSALANPIPNWLRLMRKDCGGSEVALWNKVRPHNGPLGAFVVRTLQICVLILAAIAMAAPLAAEDVNAPNPGAGRITGTVTDVDNDTVAGATVVLKGPVPGDPRTVVSDDDGFFELKGLEPGTYSVGITANGFAAWTSPPIIVNPGQYVILTGSKLNIAEVMTTVSVDYSPEEVAIEQVRIEEEQRVLGIFPNFYVVYDHDAAPLTTKLKFQLAFKTSTDPVTVIGVGVLAGINQAGDTPNYPQGLKGYGERYGAVATDGLSDIMIGGASCHRFCTRTRVTSSRARAQTSLALSTRSSTRSSAGETMDICSRTTQASAATWPRPLSQTLTIRHPIAVRDWSSRISLSAPASACSAAWHRNSSCTGCRKPKPENKSASCER